MNLATHSERLERWLGKEEIERISASMKDWYGPPIAVANIPGKVFAHKGGDFRGHIEGGQEAGIWQWAYDRARRLQAKADRRLSYAAKRSAEKLNAFTSLSDIIAAEAAGKGRNYLFNKIGPTGVVNVTSTLWYVGPQPVAGANAGAAPGGTAHVDSDTGGFLFNNPAGGDTQHFVNGMPLASVSPNTLLLYDRLFSVTKTMNSTATEAVTGVPTRYQNTSGADDAAGNFLMLEIRTVLAATAHNWTVCTYTDQDGNAAATLPSLVGNSGGIVHRLDHPAGQFFAPLASGDTGIKLLTQMQCSALVATGAVDFTIGHPIAFMPCPIVNLVLPTDGIAGPFNLARVFDDACLAFLEICKPATTATTYVGSFKTVAG